MARETDQTTSSSRSVKWTGKQPQGVAVNMHKVYRTGASRTESEEAALTKAQVEPKPR